MCGQLSASLCRISLTGHSILCIGHTHRVICHWLNMARWPGNVSWTINIILGIWTSFVTLCVAQKYYNEYDRLREKGNCLCYLWSRDVILMTLVRTTLQVKSTSIRMLPFLSAGNGCVQAVVGTFQYWVKSSHFDIKTSKSSSEVTIPHINETKTLLKLYLILKCL